jgi:hypothetical protein
MANDPVARITAIGSLFVSICTGVVGYLNYNQQQLAYQEQIKQFAKLQDEELDLKVDPHSNGLFRITGIELGDFGRVIQFPWKLQISNTGNQRVTIVIYKLCEGSEPDSKFYSGIDGGMITNELNTVSLPLTVEARESKTLYLMIGILVPKVVFQALSSIQDPKKRTTDQSTMVLGRLGIDLYGNTVDFKEFGANTFTLSVAEENQRAPKYWYVAITGLGRQFVTSASAYDHKK